MNKVFKVEGLDCAACAAELEEILGKIEGVKSASVDFMGQKVRFECDSDEAASKVAEACNNFEDVKVVEGAPTVKTDAEECGCGHRHEHGHCHGEHEHKHEHGGCCGEKGGNCCNASAEGASCSATFGSREIPLADKD